MRVFDSAYQPGTAPGAHGIYEKVFDPGDFGSGDTVQLLAANFHDGSVRADLEPVPACASLMYSALAVLAFFAKDGPYVSMKYGVDAHVLARAALDALLRGLQAPDAQAKNF